MEYFNIPHAPKKCEHCKIAKDDMQSDAKPRLMYEFLEYCVQLTKILLMIHPHLRSYLPNTSTVRAVLFSIVDPSLSMKSYLLLLATSSLGKVVATKGKRQPSLISGM